ncbi:hypothetical protein O9K51_01632 [Purpureocillium lavendulum]|uniref:Uncharacterized protein n=1 Tax=Purpureocillium lavendulum TaxID=1247861 RepID=A0AB34G618_9HYPO|nr:hypothetical protein O9K51_01632 [Purpureocillium lavendulum]
MEPNSSFLAAREVSRTPNRTMLQSFPSIAGDIDLPRRRPRTAIIDRSAEKFAVAAAIMGTCTCTHAQQVCPRCRRRAKDEVVLCLEARRIGVICSTYRKVDIPGETCPECAGRAVRRHTSQNSPYLSGWLPQSAADANNARGTGHRRQSLGQALGLAAKESLSNMRNYMKKPERVPSPGAGTLTAAAWRATHKDVDVFATTRYESAVAPRDKVIIRGRTVLDCEALSNASRSTIWFPPIDQTHTGPSHDDDDITQVQTAVDKHLILSRSGEGLKRAAAR